MTTKSNFKSILITGANAGLGKEAARRLAQQPQMERIVLAGRNAKRLGLAKRELEGETGRRIFETLVIDTSDLASVDRALEQFKRPVDALLLNAGGGGGPDAVERNEEGVTLSFATNVLGHARLTQELIARGQVTNTVLFVSSEAARGIPSMGMARPELERSDAEEFLSIADGSWFKKLDPLQIYGPIKYLGTMWMNAMARRHPELRFVSVSPGATRGTEAAAKLPTVQRWFMNRVAFPLLSLFGRAHDLGSGAQRYLDVLLDEEKFISGRFYASPWPTTSGELIDQASIFPPLFNTDYQDAAYEAVQRILSGELRGAGEPRGQEEVRAAA